MFFSYNLCMFLWRNVLSYPQVGTQLRGKQLFEFGPAQRVFIPLISRVFVEGLDHQLHSILQGGGIL